MKWVASVFVLGLIVMIAAGVSADGYGDGYAGRGYVGAGPGYSVGHGGPHGVDRPVVERTAYPNDFWANTSFKQNYYTSDNSTFVSDGVWDNGGFEADSETWAVWWFNNDYLDLRRAWAITTGDTNIVVAISDMEIDWPHYDLVGNAAYNWAEHGGTPGVDDDGNGLIDDIHGWNFQDWTDNVLPPFEDEAAMAQWMEASTTQHGTQMAGIIAAVGNNEPWVGEKPDLIDNRQGTCGVLWDARILPVLGVGLSSSSLVRTSPHSLRSGWKDQHVDYICEMKDSGAMDIRVLNMSWTGQDDYLISRCISSGILPVTGAGNTSSATVNSGCASDSILCLGGVNAIGVKGVGSPAASYGANVDACGWINPSGSMTYFVGGDWVNRSTQGWLPLAENYTSDPHFFSVGWVSRADGVATNVNVDWEGCYVERSGLDPYAKADGVMPTPMQTSGATAEGSGVAMLVFSAYPEVGPLQCKAMIQRGSSRVIYDGRNDDQCGASGGDDCAGLLGTGVMNAYRTLTLWGAVSDTTLSGTIYVSGDVYLGANVTIEAGTIFNVAPVDIYHNEIDFGSWLDCQAQYEIPSLDSKPSDLLETVEIYVGGSVTTSAGIVFNSFAKYTGSDDWGGMWVQAAGSINSSNLTFNGTERGDF